MTRTIDQYATETIPLNRSDVWNVMSAGPSSPQKMWNSSQNESEPGQLSAAGACARCRAASPASARRRRSPSGGRRRRTAGAGGGDRCRRGRPAGSSSTASRRGPRRRPEWSRARRGPRDQCRCAGSPAVGGEAGRCRARWRSRRSTELCTGRGRGWPWERPVGACCRADAAHPSDHASIAQSLVGHDTQGRM